MIKGLASRNFVGIFWFVKADVDPDALATYYKEILFLFIVVKIYSAFD
jgi:hypothetical protein